MCDVTENLKVDNELIEPETNFNYDEFFKDRHFNLPGLPHERPVKEEIQIGRKEYNGKEWKVCKVEYSTCHECEYPLQTVDHHRGERICECGLTNKKVEFIKDYIFSKQNTPGKLRTSKDSMTYEEERVLKHIHTKERKKNITTHVREKAKEDAEKENKKIHRLHVKTPRTDYNKKQYTLTLEIIASQLFMTSLQVDAVKSIINKYPLTTIHSRVHHRTTIAGICRYVLLKDGRGKGNELRFNRTAFKFVGLSDSNYNIIKSNLSRLGI